MDHVFTFTLNINQTNTVLAGLAELKLKDSIGVVQEIEKQLKVQVDKNNRDTQEKPSETTPTIAPAS